MSPCPHLSFVLFSMPFYSTRRCRVTARGREQEREGWGQGSFFTSAGGFGVAKHWHKPSPRKPVVTFKLRTLMIQTYMYYIFFKHKKRDSGLQKWWQCEKSKRGTGEGLMLYKRPWIGCSKAVTQALSKKSNIQTAKWFPLTGHTFGHASLLIKNAPSLLVGW